MLIFSKNHVILALVVLSQYARVTDRRQTTYLMRIVEHCNANCNFWLMIIIIVLNSDTVFLCVLICICHILIKITYLLTYLLGLKGQEYRWYNSKKHVYSNLAGFYMDFLPRIKLHSNCLTVFDKKTYNLHYSKEWAWQHIPCCIIMTWLSYYKRSISCVVFDCRRVLKGGQGDVYACLVKLNHGNFTTSRLSSSAYQRHWPSSG